jgi:acetyltransferase-like isoleucine patch superfamily enzyme
MLRFLKAFDTPWKILNVISRYLSYPLTLLLFKIYGVKTGRGGSFYGVPTILKHRQSRLQIGINASLRSTLISNPLGPDHPTILCTWQEGAVLEIGDHFSITGGTICAANQIKIGNHVLIGANTTIVDTDFHPLSPAGRIENPQAGKTAPVIIKSDVFVGMNCLILKGVTIGEGSVVGAGSVVTRDVPPGMIAAGNPARVIGPVR